MSRLPPNQALAAPGRWPVIGEKAPLRSDTVRGDTVWRVTFRGLVGEERSWSLDELDAMPQVERRVDVHCVTRWSKLNMVFSGVPLNALLDAAGPLPEARYVSFVARSERRHSTSLPLTDVRELDVLVARRCDGEPLPEEHGGPLRTVVDGRYFYKSLKWLEAVELLADDRLGFWEAESGYHNVADPWREERYIVRDLKAREVARLLASRDFSGRDLLSLAADRMDLAGLDARNALLRNASFVEADLRGARFDGANLANAHLQGADLRGTFFRGTDLEGADLREADLRGADLRGASLFGASFCAEEGSAGDWNEARLEGTFFDDGAAAVLSPAQQAFLARLNR